MKSYKDQRRVACAFDKNHVMPFLSYQWHLAKCKAKKAHEEKGLPILYCKYHALHIFFSKDEIEKHELTCDKNPANIVQKSADEQFLQNEDILEREDTRQLPQRYMNRYQCDYFDADIEEKEFETFDTKKRGWCKQGIKLRGFATEKEIQEATQKQNEPKPVPKKIIKILDNFAYPKSTVKKRVQFSPSNPLLTKHNKRIQKFMKKDKENISTVINTFTKPQIPKPVPIESHKNQRKYVDMVSKSKIEKKKEDTKILEDQLLIVQQDEESVSESGSDSSEHIPKVGDVKVGVAPFFGQKKNPGVEYMSILEVICFEPTQEDSN